MKKEELLEELEYIKSVLADLKPNDEERSFYLYQKYEIEKQLQGCEENEK